MRGIGIRPAAGDTIIEVAIALAILGAVLTTAYNAATAAFRVGTVSRERTEAISLAQEQAEMLRQYRDTHQLLDPTAPGYLPTASIFGTTDCPLTTCYMDKSGPGIHPAPGTTTVQGRYTIQITGNTPSGPGALPLTNYTIRVDWKPVLGDTTPGVNFTELKLTLADHHAMVLQDCSVAANCPNIR